MDTEIGDAIEGNDEKKSFFKDPRNIMTAAVLAGSLLDRSSGTPPMQKLAGALVFRGALDANLQKNKEHLEDRERAEDQRQVANTQKDRQITADERMAGAAVDQNAVNRERIAADERMNKARIDAELRAARLAAAAKNNENEHITTAIGNIMNKGVEAKMKYIQDMQLQQKQPDAAVLARMDEAIIGTSNLFKAMMANPGEAFAIVPDDGGKSFSYVPLSQLASVVPGTVPATAPTEPTAAPVAAPAPVAPLSAEEAEKEAAASEARQRRIAAGERRQKGKEQADYKAAKERYKNAPLDRLKAMAKLDLDGPVKQAIEELIREHPLEAVKSGLR